MSKESGKEKLVYRIVLHPDYASSKHRRRSGNVIRTVVRLRKFVSMRAPYDASIRWESMCIHRLNRSYELLLQLLCR